MPNSDQNFYLVGFMGSGKSYWGRQWARASGLRFLDLDDLIETNAGATIADVFAKEGEARFRELEAAALRSTASLRSTIIASGGGTPCFYDNMEWMNAQGTTIFINAAPADILRRVQLHPGKRPLLREMDEPALRAYIEQKLEERARFYYAAAWVLHPADLSVEIFVNRIKSPS